MRYSAFISYNHRDRKTASWLHGALETYRVPKALWGRETPVGVLGKRLPPVFQDREELAASTDLAASVLTALEQSASLIVICTPNGRRSRWVNEEIRTFTAMGRGHRIQCLIAGGEPNASNVPGMDPELEALPPALFEGDRTEPLGADIREGQDGKLKGKLKLLAGLLDVRYDELRQREMLRRQRTMAFVAAGSAAGMVAMGGLAAAALVQRQEALVQRQEAIRQRDIAREKTLTAERTVSFVKSLFEVADPSEARGDTITAREILDRGARDLEQGLAKEPTVRAELTTTLGEVYGGLGLLRQAEAVIRQGMALPGVEAGARMRQLIALGEAQSRAGDFRAGLSSHNQALAFTGRAGDDAVALAPRARSGQAYAQARLGELPAAKRNAEAALKADLARIGAESPEVARDHEMLGEIALYGRDMPAARKHLAQALAIRLKLQGASHPLVAANLNAAAAIAYLDGDRAAAERDFRRALAAYEQVLGPEHPRVASALNNLARTLLERRAFAEAERLLRRALAINLAQKNETADDLVFEYSNLGIAERGLGRLADADRTLAGAEDLARLNKHRNLAPVMVERAEIACLTGRAREALARLDEAQPIMAAAYKKDPWRMAWLDAVRADCLRRAGQPGRTAELMAASAPVVQRKWSADTLYGRRFAEMQALAR